jgi:hypothetical protein
MRPSEQEETMKRTHAVLTAVILGAVLFAALPKRLGGQAGDSPQNSASFPDERDLAAKKKTLLSESTDLEEMGKSLKGPDFDTALHVDQKAQQGIMELDSALWLLGIYDNMQCAPDREIAKAALKNRLAFYSYLLGLEADQVAGDLAFANSPAAAQTGMRVKDELRAAKGKLDEIVSSVN